MSAQIYLHPTLLARRAAEIARGQRGTVEQDACGRPYVRGADPLAEPAEAEKLERGRFARLIRVIRALGREAGRL